MGSYTGGLGKAQKSASSFPYVVIEFDLESEKDPDDIKSDVEDIFKSDPELSDKIQSKIAGMRFRNDPGAKSRDVSLGSGNNRNFSGRVAESIPHAHGKIPSSVLYPKKNRGPALGGVSHSPAAYHTGPGKTKGPDPGGLEGFSKANRPNFDDEERVWSLKDIADDDQRIIRKVRKMIKAALIDGSK